MNRKLLVGLGVGFAGVIIVIGLAYGLVELLHKDHAISKCCKKLAVTGTTNVDNFYQEMMGEYTVSYQDQGSVVYLHSTSKNYAFHHLQRRSSGLECPDGCWIISKIRSIEILLNDLPPDPLIRHVGQGMV